MTGWIELGLAQALANRTNYGLNSNQSGREIQLDLEAALKKSPIFLWACQPRTADLIEISNGRTAQPVAGGCAQFFSLTRFVPSAYN